MTGAFSAPACLVQKVHSLNEPMWTVCLRAFLRPRPALLWIVSMALPLEEAVFSRRAAKAKDCLKWLTRSALSAKEAH